jgi:S1-C subfamily serine protease
MPIPVPGRAAEDLRRACVQVFAANQRQQATGSGIVLPDERVLTNAHVVRGAQLAVESWEGRRHSARLLKTDRRRDLALLHVSGLRAPSISFGDSGRLYAGTPVFAVGNPLGFIGAVSSGIIHSVGPVGFANGFRQDFEWIQADVRLAPGNSGGPLATLNGQVVGLNTMVISGGLSLAIPSRAAEAFLARETAAPKLGVTVRGVQRRTGQFGLMILGVDSGGAAEAASLLPGDIITGANGLVFRFIDDIDDVLLNARSAAVTIDFYRGGSAALRHVVVQLQRGEVPNAA